MFKKIFLDVKNIIEVVVNIKCYDIISKKILYFYNRNSFQIKLEFCRRVFSVYILDLIDI